MLLPTRISILLAVCGPLLIAARSAAAEDRFTLDYNDALTSVAFATDGKSLFVGTGDGKVLWWDRKHSEPRRVDTGNEDLVHEIALSPDGKLLAAAGADRHVRVWSTSDGKLLRVVDGLSEPPGSLDFAADGKHLLVASGDRALLFDVSQEASTPTVLKANGQVTLCRFSPAGKLGALATAENVEVWSLGDAPQRQHQLAISAGPRSVAWSPDGKLLAAAGGSQVLLWSTKDFAPQPALQRDRPVDGIAFAPDGRLAVASREIEILDPVSRRVQEVHRGFKGKISSVAFSPDGTQLASTSGEAFLGTVVSELKLWDTSGGDQRKVLAGHTGRVFDVAFTPDGKQLATVSDDKRVILWDAATGEEVRRIEHDHALLAVDISPDGKRLAFGGHDNEINLWNLADDKLERSIPGHESYLTCIKFSPDGKWLASGDRDYALQVWETASGKKKAHVKAHEVSCLAWSPDSRMIAFGTRGVADLGTLVVVNWQQGESGKVTIPMRQFPRDIAWTADGKTLAVGSRDYTICLWPLAQALTAQKPQLLRGHKDEVFAVAFSPDGKLLASGGGDNVIRLWDMATGKSVRTLRGHIGRINALAFSPDGKTLASAGLDRTARLWDVSKQ